MKLTHSQISEILSNYTSSSEGFAPFSFDALSLKFRWKPYLGYRKSSDSVSGFLMILRVSPGLTSPPRSRSQRPSSMYV